jgi:Family of unknown function (DUF6171)
MDDLKDIVEGWKNLILNDPETQEVGKERITVCLRCDQFSKLNKTCRVCGCFMPAKVRMKEKKCPLGNW